MEISMLPALVLHAGSAPGRRLSRGTDWSLIQPGLSYLHTHFLMLLKWSPSEQKTSNSTPNERPKPRGIRRLYYGAIVHFVKGFT